MAMQFWTKGKTFLASMKSNRGKTVTLKFRAEDYDPIRGVVKVSENRQFRKGATHGIRKYEREYYAHKIQKEVKRRDGKTITVTDIVLGRAVRGSGKFQYEVAYELAGDSRLETGFDSLITGLRDHGGLSAEKANELYEIWNSLSNKQKIKFYQEYNASEIVKEYGSDGVNESKMTVETKDYKTLVEETLKEVMAGA